MWTVSTDFEKTPGSTIFDGNTFSRFESTQKNFELKNTITRASIRKWVASKQKSGFSSCSNYLDEFSIPTLAMAHTVMFSHVETLRLWVRDPTATTIFNGFSRKLIFMEEPISSLWEIKKFITYIFLLSSMTYFFKLIFSSQWQP